MSNLTGDELDLLATAYTNGQYVTTLKQNEGAIHTYLYETPHGHVGVSVSLATKDGIGVSVSRWGREEHHELDRYVWVKADE